MGHKCLLHSYWRKVQQQAASHLLDVAHTFLSTQAYQVSHNPIQFHNESSHNATLVLSLFLPMQKELKPSTIHIATNSMIRIDRDST